nr:hypothetical protein [Kibdelosporangium sp. MJ126-NF4]
MAGTGQFSPRVISKMIIPDTRRRVGNVSIHAGIVQLSRCGGWN